MDLKDIKDSVPVLAFILSGLAGCFAFGKSFMSVRQLGLINRDELLRMRSKTVTRSELKSELKVIKNHMIASNKVLTLQVKYFQDNQKRIEKILENIENKKS